jgi:NAD(P) transhydrogenase
MQACKLGKNVAVVEKYHKIGGSCTHKGTIPNKRSGMHLPDDRHNYNPLYRETGFANFSFAQLRRSAASVTRQIDAATFYERSAYPSPEPRFVDQNTIEASGKRRSHPHAAR